MTDIRKEQSQSGSASVSESCDDVLIYCLFSSAGTYGPDTGWAAAFPECQERNQSPINIADQDTKVSMEYQELTLDGFDAESSNKTSMKNTGKTGNFFKFLFWGGNVKVEKKML